MTEKIVRTISKNVRLRTEPKAAAIAEIAAVLALKGTLLPVEECSKKNYYKTIYNDQVCYVVKSSCEDVPIVEFTPDTPWSDVVKAFANGGNFHFNDGTYRINKRLLLLSNSVISCSKNVDFIRVFGGSVLRTSVNNETLRNNGVHDVIWRGGTFDGGGNTKGTNMIDIIHAKRICFENVNMKNVVKSHFIEINSSDNVTITGCTFGKHLYESTKEYKEAIQIDFAYHDGLAFADKDATTYDGTHCSNITISSNKFSENYVCVGTHTRTCDNQYHSNITICDNEAVGMGITPNKASGTFARLINMRNVTVSNNIIRGFGALCMLQDLENGKLLHDGTSTIINSNMACENVLIYNNSVSDCINGLKANGVVITSGSGIRHNHIQIVNNESDAKTTSTAIYASYVDNLEIVNNKLIGKIKRS